MVLYWPVTDPIDRRIFEALPDFEGWRTDERPPPKYEPWPDDVTSALKPSPGMSHPRGKMVAQHPTIRPMDDVVHEALTSPPPPVAPETVPEPAPTPPRAVQAPEDDVPVCRCGARIDDGNHLISMSMWASGDARLRTGVR